MKNLHEYRITFTVDLVSFKRYRKDELQWLLSLFKETLESESKNGGYLVGETYIHIKHDEPPQDLNQNTLNLEAIK